MGSTFYFCTLSSFNYTGSKMGKDMVTITKNILLIDDEPDITFTIKNILEDNGFKVDSFTDSITALQPYRIIFMIW
jgi:PleD family two-component response regulator